MRKSYISIALSLAMILTMLLGVMIVPASASDTITLSVTDTAGEVGEAVEVSISVSENSYLVNGDFNLYYDAQYLRYIPESCEAGSLMAGTYWAANSPIDGEIRFSFASDASVGLTEEGALFTLQFEILNKDSLQTNLSLEASPLCGCNGGEDYDITPTITGGTIGIVGGADPWNFLQESFLASGQENVSIDENGIWTVTGDFTLSPDFTIAYADWQYIAQKFTTNTPVKITLVDRDPLGVYGEHAIGLYDNFVGPQYYPVGSYDQVNSIKGIYDWNISKSGWKNTGLATIDEVIVHFEMSENVSATFTSLYMLQSGITTSSVVRTTATKPTTTTTKAICNMTVSLETVTVTETVTAGDTFTVDITVSEVKDIQWMMPSVVWDSTYLELVDVTLYGVFEEEACTDILGYVGLNLLTKNRTSLEDNTVIATITFRALKDITQQDVTFENCSAGVKDTEITCVNGGIRVVNPNAGDVTGDGEVNLNDATALFYHVNGLSTLDDATLGNADLNKDDVVDLSDATMLFYIVNGLA